MTPRRRIRLLMAIGLAASACSSPPAPTPIALDPMLPPFVVDTGDLLPEIERALAEGSVHRARRLLATFDVEARIAMLFSAPSAVSRSAAVLDTDPTRWATWLNRSAASRALDASCSRALARCRDHLVEGDLVNALEQAEEAVGSTDEGPLRGIALAWRGFAAQAMGRANARDDLVAAAQAVDPYSHALAARIHLLRFSTCGEPSAFVEAVATAGWAMVEQTATADPWFWRRAAELKAEPAFDAWPAATEEVMRKSVPDLHAKAIDARLPTAATVWAAIGDMHRRRGEAFAALVAFRKVEESGTDDLLRAFARARQSRSLLALDRAGDARAALDASLQSRPTPAVATALAMLGAIELVEERPEIARQVLDKALAAGEGAKWPLLAECLANLGVAACLCGDRDTGHRALQRARAEFLEIEDVDGLIDCLENELVCAREFALGEPAAIQRLREAVDRDGLAALRVLETSTGRAGDPGGR